MKHDTPPEMHIQNTTEAGYIKEKYKHKKRRGRNIYSWFDGPYNPVRGENSLWIAVITQAMMDALSRSRNPEARYHKQAAHQWLTGNSKDFLLVCSFAGMDPDYIRRKAKKSLTQPVMWRAAPGQGKRYLERKSYRQKKKLCKPENFNPPGVVPLPAAEMTIISGPWR